MTRKKLRSEMGWSSADRVVVRGHDLTELIGNVSLGDFAFLELKGRLPAPQESVVFNAIAVTLVEHGVTPSAIAARMTYLGAPEALQGAVAAGLLGMGDRFGGPTEEVARMLQESFDRSARDPDLAGIARRLVARQRELKRPVPGLGHPVHKPIDPRVPRLFEVAQANGFSGPYVQLIQLVSREATEVFGRDLPVNATGAIGAIASEMQLPWQVCRGLAVMARAIGLVAHLQEESVEPMAQEIWARVEEEASENSRRQG
jgi:citrate synthase